MGKLFDYRLIFEYLPKILTRLPVMLGIVAAATLIGLAAGVLLAAMRLYKIPVLNRFAIVYISFNRGTPIIVQLFIVYYGLPLLLQQIGLDINRWDPLNFVIITYGLNAAAFFSEIIRAAISSVPGGQAEAAYASGLTRVQTFQRIIAPQALLIAMPSLSTNMVGLLQDTSLAFTLGIVDVIGKVRAIGAVSYHTMEGYIGAAIIFLVLCIGVEKCFQNIEKKLKVRKS